MSEPPTLHPALVAALEADRESLNRRYRISCLQGLELDAEAFSKHLVERVERIVAAVDACFPERTRWVLNELFDVSLDIFRAGFWGSESRLHELDQLWEGVLPHLAPLVAREPRSVAGGLSNALINMSSQATARLGQWLAELPAISTQCESAAQLLDVAKILAWRCGMAQYRNSALRRLDQLPHRLAAMALGLKEDVSKASFDRQVEALMENRWLGSDCSNPTPHRNPQLMQTVSGFRGFGGHFTHAPRVFLFQNHLHVSDRESVWRIFGDGFGWFLQRVGQEYDFSSGSDVKDQNIGSRDGMKTRAFINDHGLVQWDNSQSELAFLSSSTSQAFDGNVLAITLATSFHVYLVAKPVDNSPTTIHDPAPPLAP